MVRHVSVISLGCTLLAKKRRQRLRESLEVARFLKFRNRGSQFLLPFCEMRNWNQKAIPFRFPFTIPSIPIPPKIPHGTGIAILRKWNRATSSFNHATFGHFFGQQGTICVCLLSRGEISALFGLSLPSLQLKPLPPLSPSLSFCSKSRGRKPTTAYLHLTYILK